MRSFTAMTSALRSKIERRIDMIKKYYSVRINYGGGEVEQYFHTKEEAEKLYHDNDYCNPPVEIIGRTEKFCREMDEHIALQSWGR